MQPESSLSCLHSPPLAPILNRLNKEIKARPSRYNKWWFIGNQLFLNMFRTSLRPSSGEQTACHCLWLPVLAMVVVVAESRVARCVHCAEDVACNFLWPRRCGFGGAEVACWPLINKFAGSNPAEAVGFLKGDKKFSARLPSEGK